MTLMTLLPITLDVDKTKEIYSTSYCQEILTVYPDYYQKVGYQPPWIGYFVQRDDQIVGVCGFVAPPQNNRIEIAYGTHKEYEGQGIASFSCQALISIIKSTDPNIIITAKTVPNLNPSTSILKRNGFIYSGIVQDHEIGDAWEWIYLIN